MKKTIILASLIISFTIVSCTQQDTRSPVEGAWKLVYANWIDNPTFPDQMKGSDIKLLTDGYFAFVGHYTIDTLEQEAYGGGSYKLEGNKYEEEIQYHVFKTNIGNINKMILEVKNDTLIQKWPVDENWEITDETNIEKYVRLK